MLPLAHLGIAIIIGLFLVLPIAFVAFGALLPDIVDKSLALSGFAQCGRFIAHTLIFGPIASLCTYAITRRKDVAAAVLFGCFIHLAADANYFLPLLYPFVQYNVICHPIQASVGAYEVVTESIGASLLLVSYAFRKEIGLYGSLAKSKIRRWLRPAR